MLTLFQDSGSSAPNSEDIIFEDEEDVAAELIRLEDEDCLEQIPVILRLTPPVAPGGPPVLELWGSRPFGYCGSSFIWTTFRAEPESEDVDDSDGTCWAPLGITGVDPFTYYRAMVVRQTHETMDRPPAERRMLILSYVKTEDQARISRGAILVNTYSYSPEEPVIRGNDHVVSTFWIIACGKVCQNVVSGRERAMNSRVGHRQKG